MARIIKKQNDDSLILGLLQSPWTPDSGRLKVDPSNTSTSFRRMVEEMDYMSCFSTLLSIYCRLVDGASSQYVYTANNPRILTYFKAAR